MPVRQPTLARTRIGRPSSSFKPTSRLRFQFCAAAATNAGWGRRNSGLRPAHMGPLLSTPNLRAEAHNQSRANQPA